MSISWKHIVAYWPEWPPSLHLDTQFAAYIEIEVTITSSGPTRVGIGLCTIAGYRNMHSSNSYEYDEPESQTVYRAGHGIVGNMKKNGGKNPSVLL
jgi:hypothetical protein